MKILHISTADNAGAGMCCLRIHQSLLSMGVESKMVVLHNMQHAPEEYQYGGALKDIKDMLFRIPLKLLRMMGLPVTERNKIIALQKQYHTAYTLPVSPVDLTKCEWVDWADIIHLHWVDNYLDYPSFFRKVKKPIVWTLHDEGFFYGIAHYSNSILKENEMECRYAHLKRKALSEVSNLNIVLLSEFMKQKFENNDLLKERRVRVINNMVDTNQFRPFLKKQSRKKFGFEDCDVVFAFTAMDIGEERKGLAMLSKIIMEIDDSHLKILAIGKNSYNVMYSNVVSIGKMMGAEAVSEALSAADYYAMPSSQEAFAQSPMEAMACGLPVVVFPVSGTSELVNESNGVICDDFTPEALKHGIETLMSRHYDPAKIRQDMINRFSPKAIAEKYIELYKEVLA